MAEKRALVTGGSRGIGRAIAMALAGAGHDVTIMGRSEATLAKAVSEGVARRSLALDVTDEKALSKAVTDSGPYHILVNNAGAAESAPFSATGLELLRRMMAVNVESAFTASRAALPGMIGLGFGRIINVASIAGLKGYAYVSAYCAAKHAVIGLTRALSAELVKTRITVNALCPGYTDTDLIANAAAAISAKTGLAPAKAIDHFARTNPSGRLITPEEVADAALWLCSEGASAVTGQAITIAGGDP
ncbi:SDR family oxidoreductase [Nordella sp. HKS 07]|uniref:SDR family NAD(P)-dependent oxidoreductase n=1 Tax=Nordella sp. HKS 07 TaxID=2712222 RepID=UPI0013E1528B|nr:SDR family NAD(P)-dependent oxidoreductase [Nordella sp. HKS 07]QIG47710.1 SDR family oxidoreductase [Nordella sp. HKS 07]